MKEKRRSFSPMWNSAEDVNWWELWRAGSSTGDHYWWSVTTASTAVSHLKHTRTQAGRAKKYATHLSTHSWTNSCMPLLPCTHTQDSKFTSAKTPLFLFVLLSSTHARKKNPLRECDATWVPTMTLLKVTQSSKWCIFQLKDFRKKVYLGFTQWRKLTIIPKAYHIPGSIYGE